MDSPSDQSRGAAASRRSRHGPAVTFLDLGAAIMAAPRGRMAFATVISSEVASGFAAQYARVRAASAEALEHGAIEETYAPVADLADVAARR